MSSFTNALIVEKIKNRQWKTHDGFSYEVGRLGSNEKIWVPTNFVTDLASTPRIVWMIFPPDDTYSQAAVLHDWLCVKKGRVEKNYSPDEVSDIFREAMGVLKVKHWKQQAIYHAVKTFGPKW